MLRLARAAGHRMLAASALGRLGLCHMAMGALALAREDFEQAIALCWELEEWRGLGLASCWYAESLEPLGAHEEIDSLVASVVPILREMCLQQSEFLLLFTHLQSLGARGALGEAREALARMRALQPHVPTLGSLSDLLESWLLLEEGRPPLAVAMTRRAREGMLALGDKQTVRQIDAMLALALALCGEHEEARQAMADSLAGPPHDSPLEQMRFATFHGRASALLGLRAAAEQALAEATAIGARCGVSDRSTLGVALRALRLSSQ
jgi:tetratricopeptide (TPR) repeat protein